MKNLKFICLLLFGVLFTTCDILNEVKSDDCDRTNLGFNNNFSANLLVSVIFHHNVKPYPDLDVKIEVYKKACGFDEIKPGSLFTFTGTTDSGGSFNGYQVGYDFRNHEDTIIVNIYYLKDNGSWFLIEHKEYKAAFFLSPIDPRVLQYYFDI